uniref:squalene monooxygenase-like n=1 Tax=Fragaria vesca subsp. vesca TaxID=101020 RepID=UPI0005C89FBF|nr:PREDICTED: squalene monooxygenase-like [Fragaria vesca subsp. vesca]
MAAVNRSMAACPLPTPGAILLGDSFNMRHPLTGGGMSVALTDIVLLSDLLRPLRRDLNDAPALCSYLESVYTLRKFCFADRCRAWFSLQPVSSTIKTLAGALYKVFCASPGSARQEMRVVCFGYLSLFEPSGSMRIAI